MIKKMSFLEMSERSKSIVKHIGLSAVYKPVGMLLSFFLIRFMVAYLGDEKYGIWATLLSIMSWISFFDIGVGNGLRNKLGEAFSFRNEETVKEYIATSYFIISVISIFLFLILAILIFFLNWASIFKSDILSNHQYIIFIFINVFFVAVNFITSICNQIFYAHQDASIVGLNQLSSQFILFLSLLILNRYTKGNLLLLSVFYGVSILISNLFYTVRFFLRNSKYQFNLTNIKKDKVKEIINLGGRFFIMQISSLVIFTTDNLLITQLFGPAEVTKYDIVYKLFSLIIMGYNIILYPLWSGFTDAFVKADTSWIKRILRQLIKFHFLVIFACIVLGLLSQFIIKFWIGKKMDIPVLLIFSMTIYTIINTWNGIFASFLNGVSKINLSMIVCIIQGILNIPLSIYLAKYFGISGVIMGTIVILLISAVVSPFQTFFILKNIRKDNETKQNLLYS